MILFITASVLVVATVIRFRAELFQFRRELLRLDDNASTLRHIVEQLEASNDRFSKVRRRSQFTSEID